MKYLVIFCLVVIALCWSSQSVQAAGSAWWPLQSIDTMKSSRDLAGQVLDNPDGFTTMIDFQVKAIADAGATHIGIATPYDERFIPVLRLWVTAARKYHLNVWFRGNFAGWEGWFGVDKIDRAEHIRQLRAFLNDHPELFAEGDAFSSCPECENGGPGDPRQTGDVDAYRAFLIEEYTISKDAFYRMGKNVTPNLHSMNADVARLVMDPATTQALGGTVVIDHYVKSPEQLVQDVREIAAASQGRIVLGEFGAPIPDLQGEMSEREQAAWIDKTLSLLALEKSVVGVNYWVNIGGSTQIWNQGGSPRLAVEKLRHAFIPPAAVGVVHGRDNAALAGVTVKTPWRVVQTKADGSFVLPLADGDTEISVFATGYHAQNIAVPALGVQDLDVRLEKEQYSLFDRFKIWLQRIFG